MEFAFPTGLPLINDSYCERDPAGGPGSRTCPEGAATTRLTNHHDAAIVNLEQLLEQRPALGPGIVGDTVAKMNAEVEQGRPAEAARLWMEVVCDDEEVDAMMAKGLHEVAAAEVPADLRFFEQLDPAGPSMTDPDLLATITVPILLLEGDRALPVFERGNRHVIEHAPNAENRIVAGAGGHAGPRLAPEAVASELIGFLEGAREPA